MKAVQSLFLKAKHWHIFVVLFVIPQLASFAAIASMQIVFFSVMTAIFGLCLLAWYWALGSFLSSASRPKFRMNIGLFRFAVLYPLCYVPFFMWVALDFEDGISPIIIPLHLLAMACMIYVLYFVSKSLVLAETGKAASFSDYVGPLILFWFFPLGIWFVQPRVNRLYKAAI